MPFGTFDFMIAKGRMFPFLPLAQLAPDLRMLADKEGLSAHRYSVDVRLEDSHPAG